MTNDEKLSQVLELVQETRAMALETRSMLIDERALNNHRFSQLSSGLSDLKKEVTDLRMDLNAKIDRVYDSLSQDIQVFGEDLHQVKRRVSKLEKRLPS